MRRKPKLYLVGNDPADVFDDLDQLRAATVAPQKRTRAAETFARIPHDRALALRGKLSGDAWQVLIELDRLILKAGGRNPVRFWSARLHSVGLKKESRARALRHLEKAGVIKIQQRGHGLSPLVLHLWYPRHH